MKKNIALILASASVAAVAAPAAAQDSPFTGPRAEIVGGFDSARSGSSTDNDFNENDDQSIEGILYGVNVGYDFSLGNVVLGAEAELSDSSASADLIGGDDEDLGFGARIETDRDIYLGARLGFLAGENAMIYAKAGYTNARFDFVARDGTTELVRDLDLDGWRVGAGAEYALSDNMYVKAEYRYSNYTEGEFDFSDADIFDDDMGETDRFDADLDRHQVAIGLGIRF